VYDAWNNNPAIRTMKTNKDLEGVIDALGKWRFFLGIKEKASKEEIIVNVQFIREHFGDLNVQDIHDATSLSIAGKLDVDNNHYGNFGPLYIARILNAYREHRNQIISWCKTEVKKIESAKTPPRDLQKELKEMKEFFIRAHAEANKEGYFQDYGDVWYNFAKRNKFLVFSEDLIERAKKFGILKAQEDAHEGILLKIQLNQQMTSEQKAFKQRSYSRAFVVTEWMKSIKDPKGFAKSITLKMLA